MPETAGPRLALRPGITLFPGGGDAGELVVRLNSRVLRLRGSGTRRVLELLDGTRTLEEVCRALHPAPPEQVAAAVERFRRHGLLEPELEGGADARVPAPLLRALHDLGADAREVAGALAAGSAGVWGRGALAEAAAGALERCGVGRVLRLAEGDGEGGEIVDVAVAAPASPDAREVEGFNAAALARGLPWILVQAGGFGVRLGPFVLPGETACFTCYRLRAEANLPGGADEHRAALESVSPDGALAPADDLSPGVAHLAAELAALEVVRFLAGRVAPEVAPELFGRVAEYALLQHRAAPSRVLRLPRCPACGARAAGHPPVRAWMEPYDYRRPS